MFQFQSFKSGTFSPLFIKDTMRLNVLRSILWIALALIFNVGLYFEFGAEVARDFLAGYLIEKLLSVDNLFVFLVIFSFFQISKLDQHRILRWGILGAVVARGVFVLLGSALLEHFHFMIYVMGVFLIGTGVHMGWSQGERKDLESSQLLRVLKRVLPLNLLDSSGKFFVRDGGQLHATRLFLVLVFVEVSDLMFAVDSVPAVLAITPNPWVVYSSNLFAILGLRSLFFVFQDLVNSLPGLQHGVSAVLVFVGLKMTLADLVPISTGVSLIVILALLVGVMGILRLKKTTKRKISQKFHETAKPSLH